MNTQNKKKKAFYALRMEMAEFELDDDGSLAQSIDEHVRSLKDGDFIYVDENCEVRQTEDDDTIIDRPRTHVWRKRSA
jgi:hypothetical protein